MQKALRALAMMALIAAIPATAIAAAPTNGGQYAQEKDGRYIVSFMVSDDGKKVSNFSGYTDCNRVPFNPPVSMKINKSGTFALTGKKKDVIGGVKKLVVSGKFVSATKARGFYQVSDAKSKCKSKKVKFTATLQPAG